MDYARILKWSPNQLRNPAGSPEGGRWAKGLTPQGERDRWHGKDQAKGRRLGTTEAARTIEFQRNEAPTFPKGTSTQQREYIAGLSPKAQRRIRDAENKVIQDAALAEMKANMAVSKSPPLDRTPSGEHRNTLRTPIVEHSEHTRELGGGINESLVVEIDGKEFVFKPVEGEKHGGSGEASLAEREVIASRMDDELGFDLVPMTVMGEVEISAPKYPEYDETPVKRIGSLQEFQAGARNYGVADVSGLSRKDIGNMAVLDALLGNTDRHTGNAMVKGNQLIAIDHGYTMSEVRGTNSLAVDNLRRDDLPTKYQGELAERIEKMDVARVLDGSHIGKAERASFERRRKIVINQLRKGEIHLIGGALYA